MKKRKININATNHTKPWFCQEVKIFQIKTEILPNIQKRTVERNSRRVCPSKKQRKLKNKINQKRALV